MKKFVYSMLLFFIIATSSIFMGCVSNGEKFTDRLIDVENVTDREDDGKEALVFEKIDDKDEYALIGFIGLKMKKIVIPEKFNNMPVTRIENNVFKENDEIEEVIMPNTITSHKRSLNYVNSWCVEEKRFFFPSGKSLKYTFF